MKPHGEHPPSGCRLGRMCQNPQCPHCFPELARSHSLRQRSRQEGAWGSDSSLPPIPSRTIPKPSPMVVRETSANLVELVVILCTRNGSHRHVLSAIRCDPSATLQQLRSLLQKEIASLPAQYSFLRLVGGHVVQITAEQESGPKAYKAKHFLPPVAAKPHLLLYARAAPEGPRNKPSQPAPAEEQLVEFCVRRLVEGKQYHHENEPGEIVGMIRLSPQASLPQIRQDLATQLLLSNRYRFVRLLDGQITLLTTAQEENAHPQTSLRASHFAPPYTARPEIVVLAQKTYVEGEVVPDETKTRELKSLASALQSHSRVKGRNPRDMVKDKAATYINAFLNSSGGVLLMGASDDGVIERVPIAGMKDNVEASLADRVALARTVKDDIRKLVDGICIQMDPAVEDDLVTTLFVPVRRKVSSKGSAAISSTEEVIQLAEEEIYNVIEIHVKPGRRSIYFLDKHSLEACERRDGSTHCMDEGTIAEALHRGEEEGSTWRGGWRQLRSPFGFNKLMRRLSDPWAGREWLFASVRQQLFRQMQDPSSGNGEAGVCLTGSRGVGKTSFLSELALRPKYVTSMDVVAHHLCRADDPDTLNPGLFVHSLAAMLARGFKEYRALMIDSFSEDSIGATMLRALRQEHCESDPDDAFLRGVLQPLWEIDARRKSKNQSKLGFPLVILVDAVDESLAVGATVKVRRRPGSATVAQLLERGLAQCGGLPSWIKLIVSCREELLTVAGSIQSLVSRLAIIDLDPDQSSPVQVQQAKDDIRLFIEAYIESTQMTTPFSGHCGRGFWRVEDAKFAAKKLDALRGRKCEQWQYEAKPGEWVSFDELVMPDLDFAQKEELCTCSFILGKQLFKVEMKELTLSNPRSGKEHKMRVVVDDSPEDSASDLVEPKDPSSVDASVKGSCIYCKEGDHHIMGDCTKRVKDAQEHSSRATNDERENNIFDELASNSGGNYLYARSVLEDLSSGRLKWEQVPSLPRGLDHLYNDFFRQHLGGTGVETESGLAERRKPVLRAVKPVLEVLLAAPKQGIAEREIAHAVVSGGACDPAAVAYCLRDIRWALDIDNSGPVARYSLRHESIRAWLREEGNASMFGLREQHGHALLAASLLQRCWPQQVALSRWIQSDTSSDATTSKSWYQWNGWVPNDSDEDIFNLVTHLALCDDYDSNEQVELLKTVGRANLDCEYRGRTTALYSACSSGITKAVKLLLDAGADPNLSVRGRWPLHAAASKGFSETCELLLSTGAEVSVRTSSGRSALLNATCRGSVSTVRCILDWAIKKGCHELVDWRQTDTGRTPLSIAAEDGYDEIIHLLLDANAAVYPADCRGRTPIYYAARYGRLKVDTMIALVSAPRGDETLKWGECGNHRSPLHAAVWHGRLDAVRALLAAHADPNLAEDDGGSPLHEAAYFGSYGLSKEKALQRKKKGHCSAESFEISESAELKRLEILKILLDSGRCIVDMGEVHGCTPLWYAAGGGWTRAVELLVEAGASVNPGKLPQLPGKSRNGPASPLLYAIERGHYETAGVLLNYGANVPHSFDIDTLSSSTTELPGDLVHRLRAAQKLKTTCLHKHQGMVTYETATKCEPVPQYALPR